MLRGSELPERRTEDRRSATSVEMATSRGDEERGCPLGGLTNKFDPEDGATGIA